MAVEISEETGYSFLSKVSVSENALEASYLVT